MFDLHMHSAFSDGRDAPEEMVLEGIRLGLARIGISEHSFLEWDDSAMPREKTEACQAEMERLKGKYAGRIEVLRGLERDYYSEAPETCDYVIGSVHWIRMPDGYPVSVDWEPERLERDCSAYFGGDWYALAEAYFRLEADVTRKTQCDVIGHFDLVCKFNEQRRWFDESHPRYRAAWRQAADALLKSGKPFEINTGAISRGYRTDAYPSREIRAYLKERGARFILSSDAHRKEHICFGFDRFREKA